MSNLTEIPNIGTVLAEKLEAIGVTNHDELAALGSVEALIKIGAATGSGCNNMLYALEGAIQGMRRSPCSASSRARISSSISASSSKPADRCSLSRPGFSRSARVWFSVSSDQR